MGPARAPRRPRGARVVVCLALIGAGGEVSSAQPSAGAAGLTVAKLEWGDRPVERRSPGEDAWQRLRMGDPLRTGDRLRTSPDGVARLDFPWMRITLGPSSVLSIPASKVLSTVLEQGRAEFSGEGRDIVKIRVAKGEIRGGGRLVLWHEGERTAVAALDGTFRVNAAGKTVVVQKGQGTSIHEGGPPLAAEPLPEPPKGLVPDGDPAYVLSGRTAELHWTPRGAEHHVEVLALQEDDVLLARNVTTPPARIEIPWLGTFRWRVSARDAQGLESPPSSPGYVCVVEK
jgi:hypothetical protein